MIKLPEGASVKTITTVISVLTFIGSVVAGAFFVEDRYAKAADITEVRQEQTKATAQLQLDNRNMRKQQLEDKIFEINLHPVKSAIDRAQIERYSQQIHDLNLEILQYTKKAQ